MGGNQTSEIKYGYFQGEKPLDESPVLYNIKIQSKDYQAPKPKTMLQEFL